MQTYNLGNVLNFALFLGKRALAGAIGSLLATASLAANTAAANDAEMLNLAKARNCLACHQVSGKVIGPGFTEIARKYGKTPGADLQLAKKIRSGGAGVWGEVPMPANLQASEEEARLLARWILAK
jgi:cytochrome c